MDIKTQLLAGSDAMHPQEAFLRQEFVVSRVRTDPKPQNPVRLLRAQRSVTDPDAYRPKLAVLSDFLEMQRPMMRIGLEECEILVG